jgi:4-hydroxy-tetrahydrodipicolinate synthase
LAFLAQGGNGCISVTSNVAPALCRTMFLACRQGALSKAHQFAVPFAQLTAALFREASPAPVKYALSLLGFMSARVRLPLVELSEQSRPNLSAFMARLCDEYPDYIIGTINKEFRPLQTVAV